MEENAGNKKKQKMNCNFLIKFSTLLIIEMVFVSIEFYRAPIEVQKYTLKKSMFCNIEI